MRFRLRSSGRTIGIAAILLLLLLAVNSSQALAQQAQIGIYSDVSRSSCSLSDAGGGQIRAYVIVNSTTGITGVRFSAPKPACFNATWLMDETANGFPSIGDSQTDISIATVGCQTGPQHVLTMVFQSTSTTAPCCKFEILPAQEQASVVYTDCSFTQYPASVNDAYVNADATCPCTPGLDLPPSQAFNPYPGDFIINISPPSLMLTWQATDPENDLLSYDLYLGTTANPPLIASNLTQAKYTPSPTLSYTTTYYWKVVVKDDKGNSTDGVVWRFTTRMPPVPPTPVNPTPLNGATNQYRKLTLKWQLSGGTGTILGYEVHFGTTNTPPLVGTTLGANMLAVDNLALDTTYYWYVVVLGEGTSNQGALWSFHTVTSDPPPNIPINPVPLSGSTGQATDLTLQWSASDPEGEPLEYDVYFDTTADPAFKAHTTAATYHVSGLDLGTLYYWRVVAIDPVNASKSGPVWQFRTNHSPPTTPVLVAPAIGTTISPHGVQLKWTSTDPEGLPLAFDVYLGTANPPPLYASGISQGTYNVSGDLLQNASYYWKVIAHDQEGLTTEGPLWDFKTRALIPPLAPSNPSPSSGAVDISNTPTLTWDCSDPDGQTITYTVYIGTSSNPTSSYFTGTQRSFTPPFTLSAEVKYYWKVKASDSDNNSTTGPVWDFTTNNSGGGPNLPPTTPVNVAPANNAVDQPTSLSLQWTSSDPENQPLLFDVYFGASTSPSRVAYNLADSYFAVTDLLPSTLYHWRIVAKDGVGNYTSGPLWQFNTLESGQKLALGLYADASGTSCALADQGVGQRNVYVILNGPSSYTGVRFKATKPACYNAAWLYDTTPYPVLGNSQDDASVGFGGCMSGPINVMTITYISNGNTPGCCQYPLGPPVQLSTMQATDCNFSLLTPHNEPVLGISSNNACPVCAPSGYLSVAEAEDTCRASGPHSLTVDLKLNGAGDTDAGDVDVVIDPELTFVSVQRGTMIEDWPTFTYELQQGVLTIHAAGTVIPAGTAGTFARLTFTSDCCVWSSPAELGLTNAKQDFASLHLVGAHLACRYPSDGDVNGDGNITVADAQCALETYLYAPLNPPSDCGGAGAVDRADVDCSGKVTPGDAQCIFRNWLDQSCTFCNGTAIVAASAGPAPQLSLRALRENDDIVVVLHANGVRSIGALGFELKYPAGITLVRVEPPRKDTFAALQTRSIVDGRVRVGAYVNSGKELSSNGDILAIRFHALDANARGVLTLQEFVDDLGGAAQASVSLEGESSATTPAQIVLHQNSPNPFNPLTMIRFELPEPMRVRLSVFDVHGRLVKQLLDERREAGASMVEWDGTDSHARTVATGVYFYVLDAGGSRYQHKMVMLK